MNRNLITGAGLAAALMLVVLATTGGAKAEAPTAAPAPAANEQALSTTISFLAEPAASAKAEAAAKPEAPKAAGAKAPAQPKSPATH